MQGKTTLKALNFCVGCNAESINNWKSYHGHGIFESLGIPVFPKSLYKAQLAERRGKVYEECPV